MSKRPVKQPGKPESSDDPDPNQDQDRDPTPDIRFKLSKEYYFALIYQIHVKAPNDSASAVAPYFKDAGEAWKMKKKQVYNPEQRHLIIELIIVSRETGKEESLFVWMRRSDYYIIGFRSHKKTYHFCDTVNEQIGGTTLEYRSEYGYLRGIDKVILGFDDFRRCVRELIVLISKAPTETTTEATIQNTKTTTDTKKTQKANVNKHHVIHKKIIKAKPTKPTSDRSPANSYQFLWQSPISGICLYVAEAARNFLFAQIIHRTQLSSTAILDYTNEAMSSHIPPELKTSDEIYKFIKGCMKSGHRVQGDQISNYLSMYINNWSGASDTARTYNLEVGKALFLTAKEETIIEGPIYYKEDDCYKSYFNDYILTNNKLCYYLTPLKCKQKTHDEDDNDTIRKG